MADTNKNIGKQRLSFDYKSEARAETFNHLFYELLPYGIYSGGQLSRATDTSVGITPMTVIIKSNNEGDYDRKVATKIDTVEQANITVAKATPLIVCRFTWREKKENFMQVLAIAESDLQQDDIILGKCLFENDVLSSSTTPFDLSKRQEVYLKSLEKYNNDFKVTMNEDHTLNITGGKFICSKGVFDVDSVGSLAIPTPLTARTDYIYISYNYDNNTASIKYGNSTESFKDRTILALIRVENGTTPNGSWIYDVDKLEIRQGVITPDNSVVHSSHFKKSDDSYMTIEEALDHLWNNSYVLNHGGTSTTTTAISKVADYKINVNENSNEPLGNLYLENSYTSTPTLATKGKVFSDKSSKDFTKRYTNELIYGETFTIPTVSATQCIDLFELEKDTTALVIFSCESSSILAKGSFHVALSNGYPQITTLTNIGCKAIHYKEKKIAIELGLANNVEITYQVVSADRGVIKKITNSRLGTISSYTDHYPAEKGFIRNRPVFTELNALNSFMTWTATTSYKENDIVFYKGNGYTSAINNNINQEPTSTSSYPWLPLLTTDIISPIDEWSRKINKQLIENLATITLDTTTIEKYRNFELFIPASYSGGQVTTDFNIVCNPGYTKINLCLHNLSETIYWDIPGLTNLPEFKQDLATPRQVFELTTWNGGQEWDIKCLGSYMIPITNGNIKKIVKDAIQRYGNNVDLNYLDVSNVTDMSYLFKESKDFNGDISKWDVSNVTTMEGLFYNSKFNGDISQWNLASLVNVNSMFQYSYFNSPIDNWKFPNLKSMRYMFFCSKKFNQPLSHWDTSNVTDMSFMFNSAEAFNQHLRAWNTSNVKYMTYMFYNTSAFNKEVSGWDTSNVTTMEGMFREARAFAGDLDSWNVEKVKNMAFMFADSRKAGLRKVQHWKPRVCTNMDSMFENQGTIIKSLKEWENYLPNQVSHKDTFRGTNIFSWLIPKQLID